ncbi:MAG: hypothetical protein KBB33_04330 [Candidatus Cloacimonetes bacterium]|nr:hypothetical protein [Candidatus Cloacimonadota bacterium]
MRVLLFSCLFALVCMPLMAGYYGYQDHDYLSFLSANDYSILNDEPKVENALKTFSTRNKAALNLKYVGFSAEFFLANSSSGPGEFEQSFDNKRFGIGGGLPDPDFLRLYATYYWDERTFEGSGEKLEEEWLFLEASKRFYSPNMSSELSLSYSNYGELRSSLLLEMSQDLFGIPHNCREERMGKLLEVNAFVTSVTDELQEPVSGMGIAPEDYPLLLVDKAAIALYLGYNHSDYRWGDGVEIFEFEHIKRDGLTVKLPMNWGRYFGLDLAYHYSSDNSFYKEKAHIFDLTMRPVAVSSGGLNLSLLANGRYSKLDDKLIAYEEYYYLNLGAIFSLNVRNHLGFYARYLNYNDWDLANDASDIENTNHGLDLGLVLRY